MKTGYEVLPLGDRFQTPEWMENPLTEQAGPHGGEGLIDGATETGTIGAAGIDKLKIGLGDAVEKEIFAGMPRLGRRKVPGFASEAVGDVVEEGSGRGDSQRLVCTTEPI